MPIVSRCQEPMASSTGAYRIDPTNDSHPPFLLRPILPGAVATAALPQHQQSTSANNDNNKLGQSPWAERREPGECPTSRCRSRRRPSPRPTSPQTCTPRSSRLKRWRQQNHVSWREFEPSPVRHQQGNPEANPVPPPPPFSSRSFFTVVDEHVEIAPTVDRLHRRRH